MKNKKMKTSVILSVIIIAVSSLVFLALYGLKKVQWGERVTIVDSNDYYMSITTREINSSYVYHQEFRYSGNNLYSVKLKYGVKQENPDMYWSVQLYNKKELIQQWDEKANDVVDGQVVEYKLDKPYGSDSDNYTIVVLTEYEGESGIYLFGSDVNTCLTGEMYIDDEVQEGDITIVVSEIENVKVTLVYAILLSVLLSIAIVFTVYKKWYLKIYELLNQYKVRAWGYKKEIIILGCTGIVALAVLFLIRKMTHMQVPIISRFSIYHYAFVLAMAVNGMIILILRKTIGKTPEIVLCLNILVIGVMYIFVLPGDAEISWDEAIHFWRAIGASNATTGMANAAEGVLYWKSGIPFSLPSSPGNLVAAYQTIEGLYQQGDVTGANTDILTSLLSVAYVPAAFLINVGKMFGLKLWQVFKLGLIGSLTVYVTNIYFAMKKVVSGKMIVATVSCIGTAFFLATVYSSDSWIMGFSILGFSYFLSCMQKAERVTAKELIIMVGALTIAFFPKTVYFPMMLLLLLLPKEKFESEIQRSRFIAAVLASVTLLALGVAYTRLLLVLVWMPLYLLYSVVIKQFLKLNVKARWILLGIATIILFVIAFLGMKYVLPMLVGEGDLRGGDTVNAATQVVGIAQNPIKYAGLLVEFIFGRYLNFKDSLRLMFDQYGYLGTSGFYYIGIALVTVACLTDKDQNDCFKKINLTRITTALLILVSIALISTALYISFTPVGFHTVIGCQPRYLLPLIYPFLAVIGTGKLKNPIKKAYYNAILIIGINGYLLINILKLAIVRYHV